MTIVNPIGNLFILLNWKKEQTPEGHFFRKIFLIINIVWAIKINENFQNWKDDYLNFGQINRAQTKEFFSTKMMLPQLNPKWSNLVSNLLKVWRYLPINIENHPKHPFKHQWFHVALKKPLTRVFFCKSKFFVHSLSTIFVSTISRRYTERQLNWFRKQNAFRRRFRQFFIEKNFVCSGHERRNSEITLQQICYVNTINNFGTNKKYPIFGWTEDDDDVLYRKWDPSVICHVSIVHDLVTIPKQTIPYNRLYLSNAK